MNGGSLGLRTGSYGWLQQQPKNGVLQAQGMPLIARKPLKTHLASSREKERLLLPYIRRYIGRRRVAMVLLVALALLIFISGSLTVNKGNIKLDERGTSRDLGFSVFPRMEDRGRRRSSRTERATNQDQTRTQHRHHPLLPVSHLHKSFTADTDLKHFPLLPHPCDKFAIPPPPTSDRKRFGPRPCPVCYVPVGQAIARMPSFSSASPVLRSLTYVHDEDPIKIEPHGGSEFGGYPSLKQRNESFDIKESMRVHCGFVKGSKPGNHSGFDIDEDDLMELKKFHDVIVASAIFGNYDIIQQPKNIDAVSRKNIPFFLFIDEETEAFVKNSSLLDSKKKVGLWRIIVVRNIPCIDSRRNGKIPKLLLHRLCPNVRYSIWIDGKLELVKDPYQILERFLWRENATFAISRHYKRFDVFKEAEANKAAGKYDNSSIDEQIGFYVKEGLTPYSAAKLPITSDVPEGCVIIREHIPITNLFSCLWFNEVDRFTSRDQLSFSTVRDKIRARVGWSTNMFLDCERRNFVIQAYHRDLLEQMPPPRVLIRHRPPTMPKGDVSSKTPLKKNVTKRRRGDRKSVTRRWRKTVPDQASKQPSKKKVGIFCVRKRRGMERGSNLYAESMFHCKSNGSTTLPNPYT